MFSTFLSYWKFIFINKTRLSWIKEHSCTFQDSLLYTSTLQILVDLNHFQQKTLGLLYLFVFPWPLELPSMYSVASWSLHFITSEYSSFLLSAIKVAICLWYLFASGLNLPVVKKTIWMKDPFSTFRTRSLYSLLFSLFHVGNLFVR